MKKKSIQILLIEDNKGDALLFKEQLKNNSFDEYKIYIISTIHAAVEYLGANETDIIFLDLSLPDSTGLTGFFQLKKQFPNYPIIIVTGNNDECIIEKALTSGAQDFIIKNELEGRLLNKTIQHAIVRKKYEIKINQAENQLRAIIENNMDAMVIVDSSNNILFSNPAAYILFDSNTRELHSKILGTKILKSKPGEVEIPQKNGDIKIAEFWASEILWGNEPSTLFILRDLTQRIKAQRELQKSEEFNKRIIQSSKDCISVLSSDKKINFISCGGLKILEVENLDDLIGRNWLDCWPNELQKTANESLNNTLQGRTSKFKGYIQTHTKKIKWIEVTLSPIYSNSLKVSQILAIARDITEQQIFENKLRQLTGAIEQSKSTIIITDTASHIEFVNPAFEKTTGYVFEEVQGKKMSILKSGETSLEKYAELWETILSGNTWEGEFKNKKKNGDFYWEKAIISPVKDKQQNITHFVCIKEDITREKHNQDLLVQSEIRFRELFQFMTSGIIICEYDNISRTFTIKDANNSCVDMFFSQREDIINNSIQTFLPNSKHNGFIDSLQKVYETGVPSFHGPVLYKIQDISIWVESYNYKLSSGEVIAVCNDITVKIFAEKQIIKERRLLETLMNHSIDFIFFKDLQNRYTHINKSFVNWFKAKDAYDILGKTDTLLFSNSLGDKINKDEQAILNTGIPLVNRIYKFKQPGDSSTWLSTTKVPLYDDQNKIIGTMGISRDITKQMKTENELKNYKLHLEELVEIRTNELKKAKERLSNSLKKEKELNKFKSNIVSTVSHDFRTPLAVIQSSTEILQMLLNNEQNSVPGINKHFVQVQSAVIQMTGLLEDMLQISRIDSGKRRFVPKLTQIRPLFEKIINEAELACKNSHTIQMDYNVPFSKISIDDTLIGPVLRNLLSNAIKYSPDEKVINLSVTTKDKTLYISVQDYGIGIPATDQDKIFSMFHRAGNVSNIKGTGLGLSIVKSYVDLHGGKISFESKHNLGTTFVVSIPFSEFTSNSDKPQEMHSKNWSTKKALLVEDNSTSAFYMKEILKDSQLSIKFATRGLEAIQMSKEDKFDIIILDIELPDMHGYDVAKQIRAFDKKTPVIAVTAYIYANDKNESIRFGCNEFLTKPLNSNMFLSKLGKYLDN